MKLDYNSLRFKLFIYLIMLSFTIIFILWCIQVLFIENYYVTMKTSELKSTASTIIESLEKNNFEKILSLSRVEGNLTFDITDAKGVSIFKYRERYQQAEERIRHPIEISMSLISRARDTIILEEKNSISFVSTEKHLPKFLIYGQKFYRSNNEIFYLFLCSNLQNLNSTEKMLKNQIIYVSIILFILTFAISIILSRKLSRPIINITNLAKLLAQGNYNIEFKGNSYTEINLLADTLNYATKELSKTESVRRELIANVSHDLRTPLTMIKAYAEMIRDLSGNKPEKRVQHLKVIIDESDRLSLLVDDLLDLSKVQSGVIKFNCQSFNISKTVLAVMERYSFLIEREGYYFDINCEDNLYVCADQFRIIQVIYNLINNAINYTGEDKRIKVSLFRTGSNIRFEVRDTGIGIPKEQQSLIWDRYFKLDKVHKRAVVGNGLGLCIVKNILIKHKAQYGVVSSENNGSMFWFSLSEWKQKDGSFALGE